MQAIWCTSPLQGLVTLRLKTSGLYCEPQYLVDCIDFNTSLLYYFLGRVRKCGSKHKTWWLGFKSRHHILSCKPQPERTNWECHMAMKSGKPSCVTYSPQQAHRPWTYQNSAADSTRFKHLSSQRTFSFKLSQKSHYRPAGHLCQCPRVIIMLNSVSTHEPRAGWTLTLSSCSPLTSFVHYIKHIF